MKVNIGEYGRMLTDHRICVIYNGPMWADELDSFADMLQKQLDLEDLPLDASQSVFSVFVELMNNMIMYSAEKKTFDVRDRLVETARGTFILGMHEKEYFVQTGNVVKNSAVEFLKKRIDHLNTLDKNELRQFYKRQILADDNPESRGAGIGLIEIARRATSKIDYEVSPIDDGTSYFTMYVTI